MTRDEIVEDLNGVFREVFDDPLLSVTDDMTAEDVAEWDSLNHVTMIVAVEKKFGVRFFTREVSSLKNAGELIDLIHVKSEVPAK